MHSREKVELFPPAREDGMSVRGAAEFAGVEEFMALLDAEMRYHRNSRIKRSLGWKSPMEHRMDLGYVV